ncbi:MAG: DUF4410 domain-containing protein [Desulfatitalea sp.]|nr:DUF4410 domain-containing protein [Desulfatitalea sp.]MBI5896652.1 DUF4410 domain-containing protein [Desulfobacterales bacterium]
MRTGCKEFTNLVVMLTILALCACAGTQSTTTASEEKTEPAASSTVNSVQQAKPLDARFSNILVKELKTTDAIKKDYPEALADLETSLIAHLRSKKAYARVAHSSDDAPLKKSLFVNLTIAEMRIPSSGARFWGGPFAGSSFMNIELELVDGASGKTLRREAISSSNSSMAASWNFGASDRSLPSDMGVIAAEYIYTVAPPEK